MSNDNPPAFPVFVDGYVQVGMTLRDYFAAKVLAEVVAVIMSRPLRREVMLSEFSVPTAKDAYAFADAMLAERQRSSK